MFTYTKVYTFFCKEEKIYIRVRNRHLNNIHGPNNYTQPIAGKDPLY